MSDCKRANSTGVWFSQAKLENLILYFSGHDEVTGIGRTKLFKLIYFADVQHMRDFGTSITESQYVKYPYGPVASRAEKLLKRLTRNGDVERRREVLDPAVDKSLDRITAKRRANIDIFSGSEMKAIDAVVVKYGKMSATELSDLSHNEPAWIAADHLGALDPDLMHYGPEEDPEGL